MDPKDTPAPEKPSRLAAAVESLTNHQGTVKALKEARAEVARLEGAIATTKTETETAVSSLELAITERDAAQSELTKAQAKISELEGIAAKVTGLETELATATAKVGTLEAAAKTVTQGVTAELETLGVKAEDLPGTERVETTNKGADLLAKFNSAKDGAERIKIIREAKAAGIKMSSLQGLN